MSLGLWILRKQEIALCFVRKWWRPATCAGIAVGTWVNLVFIPILTRTVPNMGEAAAWITACTAAFAVREWGKAKGNDE